MEMQIPHKPISQGVSIASKINKLIIEKTGHCQISLDLFDEIATTFDTAVNQAVADATVELPDGTKMRKRNELMDALATGCGNKLSEMTSSAWARVAKALKEIKEVCPDITPDDIFKRCNLWRKMFHPTLPSPQSISRDWSKLATEDKRKVWCYEDNTQKE